MITTVACSWCHQHNPLPLSGPCVCRGCGHHADVARLACACPRCRPTAHPAPEQAPAPVWLATSGEHTLEAADTLAGLLAVLHEVFEPGLGEDVVCWHGAQVVCVLTSAGQTIWLKGQRLAG